MTKAIGEYRLAASTFADPSAYPEATVDAKPLGISAWTGRMSAADGITSEAAEFAESKCEKVAVNLVFAFRRNGF